MSKDVSAIGFVKNVYNDPYKWYCLKDSFIFHINIKCFLLQVYGKKYSIFYRWDTNSPRMSRNRINTNDSVTMPVIGYVAV